MAKIKYTIMINEAQRLHIVKALNNLPSNTFSNLPESGEFFETEQENYECLVRMFDELPKEQASSDNPNLIHGFCL